MFAFKTHTEGSVREAMIQCLKGTTLEGVRNLGDEASIEDIFAYLTSTFQGAAPFDTLLKNFFQLQQEDSEKVAQYSRGRGGFRGGRGGFRGGRGGFRGGRGGRGNGRGNQHQSQQRDQNGGSGNGQQDQPRGANGDHGQANRARTPFCFFCKKQKADKTDHWPSQFQLLGNILSDWHTGESQIGHQDHQGNSSGQH